MRPNSPFQDFVELEGESSSVKGSETAETKVDDTIQKIIEPDKFHYLYTLLIVQSHFVDNGIFESFRAV